MNTPAAAHEEDVFHASFDETERKRLLAEDREAQLGISAILGALIAVGMCLGLFSVWLISTFGF